MLESVYKVGERLVANQKKKIVFLIRDCSADADKVILRTELER